LEEKGQTLVKYVSTNGKKKNNKKGKNRLWKVVKAYMSGGRR